MLGCLFTYSLDRTKQIDQYRSIDRSSEYVTIKTAAAVASEVAASAAAVAAAAAAVSKKKKKNYHGWLIEILRFILEELKIMAE